MTLHVSEAMSSAVRLPNGMRLCPRSVPCLAAPPGSLRWVATGARVSLLREPCSLRATTNRNRLTDATFNCQPN
jgi:hypothetical protein